MEKSVFLISEAAKEVCVENHVLRYWEEELSLPVKRNAQGHRYYTAEDVKTFKKIKRLKEQGIQLKAIKLFLSGDGKLVSCQTQTAPKKEEKPEEQQKEAVLDKNLPKQLEIEESRSSNLSESHDFEGKAQKLQFVLKIMIEQVLKEYDSELKEAMLKELDYQFRMQEERDEQQERERSEKEEKLIQRIEELIQLKKEEKKKQSLIRRKRKKEDS